MSEKLIVKSEKLADVFYFFRLGLKNYAINNFANKVFEIFYEGNNFVNKVFEIFYIGNNKKPIRQFEFKKRIVVLSYFLNCFTIQKVRQKIHILTRWR